MSNRATVLQQLRPPYAGSAKIVYGFSRGKPSNFGYTLSVPAGSTLVAPGDGQVELIQPLPVGWRYSQQDLKGGSTAIRINHGFGVKTWIHGLNANTTANLGTVARGTALGTAQYSQVFFAVEVLGSMADPAKANSFFVPRNGFLFTDAPRTLRQAPNVATRLANTLSQWWQDNLRYFTTAQTFFVNVDFNGDGTKAGTAVVGNDSADFWNVVAPADFTAVIDYYCTAPGYDYSISPGIMLNDYRNMRSTAFLRRVVQGNFSGSTATFDPMLTRYVGGYTGMTARENTFDIWGLSTGSYTIYAYNYGSVGEATTFNLGVNGGTPTTVVSTPTASAASTFIQNENYAKFTVSVSRGDYLTLQSLGYLCGLQIAR